MPIYEYRCSECGHVYEALQRNSREAAPSCPECGGEEARRLLSAARAHVGKSSESGLIPCCGRDTPCEAPPCADGICSRN
jgi:putative FmdB family regulatory protein